MWRGGSTPWHPSGARTILPTRACGCKQSSITLRTQPPRGGWWHAWESTNHLPPEGCALIHRQKSPHTKTWPIKCGRGQKPRGRHDHLAMRLTRRTTLCGIVMPPNLSCGEVGAHLGTQAVHGPSCPHTHAAANKAASCCAPSPQGEAGGTLGRAQTTFHRKAVLIYTVSKAPMHTGGPSNVGGGSQGVGMTILPCDSRGAQLCVASRCSPSWTTAGGTPWQCGSHLTAHTTVTGHPGHCDTLLSQQC
jgi:hypothetical protein